MLCKICTTGLQGIWDPAKTDRVGSLEDFRKDHPPMEDSKFVTAVWTYQVVEQYDPQQHHPEKLMFGHHRTRESFEKSVRDGCVMCKIFKSVQDPETQTDSKSIMTTYGYYSVFSVSFREHPVMSMYVEDNSSGGFELCHHVEDENWNLDISSSTGDDTTWAIAQRWLYNCLESHHECNKNLQDISSMPTRLINIEQDSHGGEASFRIVPGTQVEPGTRYIAVSHCCDSDSDSETSNETDLKLTHSRLDQLSTFQPSSMLPLTFRHTLVIAARLGIAYIWIDQLCTIQDDLAEQATQPSKRPNVFRNAFLAIGVSGTTSTSSGLFATRDPFLVAPTVFDFPIDGEEKDSVPYISSCEHPNGWESAFHANPLFRNARAVADRLNAPRMVHFGSNMIFWECYLAQCAEIHPHGVDKPALGSIYRLFGIDTENKAATRSEVQWKYMPWKPLLNLTSWQNQLGPIHQVFFDWVRLVEMHSNCESEAPEERLNVLQDMVEYMKLMLQERGCTETQYVAGMWKALLPASLTWTVSQGTRTASNKVPSWSWAALSGRLNFPLLEPYDTNDNGLLCELVRLGSTTTTSSKESVFIKGKLALAKLYPRISSLRFNGEPMVLIQSFVNENVPEVCLGEPTPEPNLQYNYEWAVRFDTNEDIAAHQVLSLPIRIELAGSLGYRVDGLALSRLENGCYLRRGTWGILVDSKDEALDIFKDLPERMMELV